MSTSRRLEKPLALASFKPCLPDFTSFIAELCQPSDMSLGRACVAEPDSGGMLQAPHADVILQPSQACQEMSRSARMTSKRFSTACIALASVLSDMVRES